MKVYLSEKEFIYILFPSIKRVYVDTFVEIQSRVLFIIDKENSRDLEEIKNRYNDIVLLYDYPEHGLDVCLQTKKEYLEYIAEGYDMKLAKPVLNSALLLNDKGFFKFLKHSIFLGKWSKEFLSSHEKMYNLFKVVLSSKKDFLQLYSELAKSYSMDEIFASMLTFLLRIQNYEEKKDSLSVFYRNIVKTARIQNSSIGDSLVTLTKMSNDIPKENRYIGFYLSLRG